MSIAVVGCGAIGGLFLGYLSEKGKDTVGLVKQYQQESFLKEGLLIEGVRGKKSYPVTSLTRLTSPVDYVIFATKIDDLETVVRENIEHMKDAYVLTTQNGVKAEYILRDYFPENKIVAGIVMFGATYYPPNRIIHHFENDLVLGDIFNSSSCAVSKMAEIIQPAFHISRSGNIKGAKYLKVMINLNNAIPASLGISMQEAFSDIDVACLAVDLNKEAYLVLKESCVTLESLSTYPKERIESLVGMEDKQAATLLSKIITSLSDRPLYGSILQSIKRGKKSEVDYINGEIVRLAEDNGLESPVNKAVVEAVHEVERTGRFLSKEELIKIMSN